MHAAFLDRDGVINENRADYVKSWNEFCFLPGAVDGIVELSRAGVQVFVVSNQAAVGRGILDSASVEAINRQMVEEVERAGGRIEGVTFCPHSPEDRCACRKPQPGLLFAMARDHGVDLTQSVLIGDALTDIEAGQAAGCQTILVLTGRGRDQAATAAAAGRNGFTVAPDLSFAARLFLERSGAEVISRGIA